MFSCAQQFMGLHTVFVLPASLAYIQMCLRIIKHLRVPVRKTCFMEREAPPVHSSERYPLVSKSEAYRSQFSVGLAKDSITLALLDSCSS